MQRTTPKESKQETAQSTLPSKWIKGRAPLWGTTEYRNERDNADISFIFFEDTNEFRIFFKGDKFKNSLLAKCYTLEIPVEDMIINIKLDSNNRYFISSFIHAIASVATIPDEIVNDIFANLPKQLIYQEYKSEAHDKSFWLKEGDFSLIKGKHLTGSELIRDVTYKNLKALKDREHIFIGAYNNTNNVKIIYRNKHKSKTLLKKCYELEIPVEDDLLGGIILNTDNKVLIDTFIRAIDGITPISEKLKNEIRDSLPATLREEEFKSTRGVISHWLREGDFERYSGANLVRSISYKNTKNLQNKEQIFIGTYKDTSDLRIIYRNKDEDKADALLKICYQLEIPVRDGLIGSVSLQSANKQVIMAFINAIDLITPIDEQCKKEIQTLLPSNLKDEEFKSRPEDVSKWIKEGDFARVYDSGAELNRSVRYKNTRTLKDEEEIFIGGYRNTESKQICYQNKNKEILNAIEKKCKSLNLPIDYDSLCHTIRLSSSEKLQLASFILIIDSERTLGQDIYKDISNSLHQSTIHKRPHHFNFLSSLIMDLKSLSDTLESPSQKAGLFTSSHSMFGGRRSPDEKKHEDRLDTTHTMSGKKI